MTPRLNQYSILIRWSDDDKGYIATCPEFPGLSAFGEMRSTALQEAAVALELFVETYNADGETLPEPNVVRAN
jgi:predicted RNase H-like HicB family nuclease